MIVDHHLNHKGIIRLFLVVTEILEELGKVICAVLPEELQHLFELGSSKSAFKSLRHIASVFLCLLVHVLGQLSGLAGCVLHGQVRPEQLHACLKHRT